MELLGIGVDAVGVLIVVVGASFSTVQYLFRFARKQPDAYQSYRHALARAILLGLEFLIAGDIIRTVAIEPTLYSVLVLAVIVLVRTFLSFTLELELHGHWPWARASVRSQDG
jgi:uncharacterized membrane protein